ncbi:MAG: hypothetical protein HYY29_00360, partial [Chloroflexi bacterium]|nr:hypothetical protein [Chloroflexota bacterium]
FPFFDYVKQWNEDLARAINSTIRTYDAWLKGVYAIAGEGYEMNRKMGAGEEVDVNRFIKAWRNAYDGITGSVVEAFNETPFAGLKNVDRAVKGSLDSMPAEQEMVRDLFSQIVHFNARLMNVLSSAMGEGGKRFSHMMEQGTIKGNGYESAVQTYGELLNDYIGISRVSAGLPRAGRAMEEDVTTWTRLGFDVWAAWTEMNFKLFQGLSRSAADINQKTAEVLKEAKEPTPERMYLMWMDIARTSLETALKNSRYFESLSSLIDACTEWAKATGRLYRGVTAPAYASKDDLEQLSEELRRLKASVEKKTARARVEEDR